VFCNPLLAGKTLVNKLGEQARDGHAIIHRLA